MDHFLSTWLVSPLWSELVARVPPGTSPSGGDDDVRHLVHQLTLQALDDEPGLRLLGPESDRISAALTTTLMALDTADVDLARDPDRLVERMRLAAPDAAAELTDERA